MSEFRRILLFILIPVSISGQSFTSYFTGNIYDTISNPQGGICLMGGATEDDEAMKWFLSRCSGGDVLVLRASGSNGYNNYMFHQLGVKINSVESIVCNSKSASGDPYILQKIKQAEAIWFAGGDQWDYVSFWRNTQIDSLINEGIHKRHIVVGGTSAGMAIMGGFYFSAQNGTVTSSEALRDPYNLKMTIDSAGFLKCNDLQNVITDTHYDNPDRKGRHITFLARILTDWGIDAKGIACDAYSAVCIDTFGMAHCYGDFPRSNDYIYFLQTNCENIPDLPEHCISESPLDWNINNNAVKVYKTTGTKTGENTFNLRDWKTGNGGEWENWFVSNGLLQQSNGDPINCQLQSDIKFKTENTEFLIYPNPLNKGELSINYPITAILEISIMDIYGRVVRQLSGSKMLQNEFDVSGLPLGLYVIIIETRTAKLQSRLILN
jgi:cyanophycinase-like exopeptidase